MNDESMNQTDQILEQLRPRMHAARVSHVRRMVGVFAIVPLLGIGAMAMAAESDSPTEIETAGESHGATDDEVRRPEIGDAGAAEHDETDVEVTETDDEVPTTTKAPKPTTTEAPDGGEVLEVGVLGAFEVEPTEDSFKVLSHSFTDGWEIIESETTEDGTLRIYVTDGDVIKVIIVKHGIRDEILVHVEEWTPPTTTTTTVKPKPEPEPEPEPEPIVDRFAVEVPGHGSFIVEREGEMLWVGNVTPAEGHEYEVHQGEGWKVWVGFYAEGHVWFGKAQINDNGDVQLIFWDEELAPEPVHQWVEISGVGAAKFAILDGQIKVVATETAEGFGSWDYNQGAWAETAKVDFEGEGQIWFIDAWLNEGGELVWNSYQGE